MDKTSSLLPHESNSLVSRSKAAKASPSVGPRTGQMGPIGVPISHGDNEGKLLKHPQCGLTSEYPRHALGLLKLQATFLPLSLSVCLSTSPCRSCTSLNLSLSLCLSLSISLPVSLPIRLPVILFSSSICPPVFPSLLILLSVCASIYLSIYLFLCLHTSKPYCLEPMTALIAKASCLASLTSVTVWHTREGRISWALM